MIRRSRKITTAVVSGYSSPIVPSVIPCPNTNTFGSRKPILEYTQQEIKFRSTAERTDRNTVD
jgi:hypothetical protein